MAEPKSKYKIAIVAPTCFYYQTALFRKMATHPRLDLIVYFCSDEALHALDAREMYSIDEDWGDETELLNGYQHKFLKNHSPRPSYLKWPFGLMNFSIWNEIRDNRPDVVVLMSWMNVTWWLAILACLRYKVPFLYMTDANVLRELGGPRWKRWIKALFLGSLVFNLATGFLCAGTANRRLYEIYGVPEEKLVPFAYSWGYETHLASWDELRPQRKQLRQDLGIVEGNTVILYCGRLSDEKSPLDLLQAYQLVESESTTLAIVGDGELRSALKIYANQNGLDSVRFLGFKNRNEIAKYYATADLLVLPSKRDTWGIVVSEALCYALPVIASDQVGAAHDLVHDGENGFVFPSGDVQALADRINQVIKLPIDQRNLMGSKSRERIEKWVGRDLIESLDQYLDWIYSGQPR